MSFKNIHRLKRKESFSFRKWSENDLNLLRFMTEKNLSVSEISFLLGRSYDSIVHARRKNFLSNSKRFSSSDIRFIKCNLGKLSCSQISRHLGFSFVAVYDFCKRNNLYFRVFGDAHGNTVHSDYDVELMRSLYDEGVSVSDIASKFEIPLRTVKSCLDINRRHLSSDYYLHVD